MTLAFWFLVAVICYTYAGYPVVVAIAARILGRRVEKRVTFPALSVVIAAYNESEAIEGRISNLLASEYPADKLEIVVASDGSGDDTVARARAMGSRNVRVLDLPRCGKAAALTAGALNATGDVLVFTDANTWFRPNALAMLALSFGDPEVGGVAGHTGYVLDERAEATDKGEDLYWRYDTWLKEKETLTGSVVSAHGGMYAVRAELFRPVEDPAVTDDFAISTAVVDQGRRLVFEPRALGYEKTMSEGGTEFRRRVRLMTRGVRSVLLRRRLLNPFRHGFYSAALFSRKVLRRLIPLAFVPLVALTVALAGRAPFYAGLAAAETLFIALAGTGWLLRRTRMAGTPAVYVPLFFCMANLASVLALWNVARGRRIERWTPQRHGVKSAAGSTLAVGDSRIG